MTEGTRNVFVGGLNIAVTKADLEKLFKQYGKISSIYISVPNNNASYTFGFIRFENEDNAACAIEKLNGIVFFGRRLRVEPGRGQNLPAYQTDTRSKGIINYHEPNDRGKYLSQFKNIYSEVWISSVRAGSACLPDLSQLLADINQISLVSEPVFGNKKPQCRLDLDILDDLSEQFYNERRFNST